MSHSHNTRRCNTSNKTLESVPSSSSTTPISTPPASPPLHLPYEYAQKLNNNAALGIEYGQFQRAESSLAKALRLSRAHIEATSLKVCRCYHCTLDGCVIFSEDCNRALNTKVIGRSCVSDRRHTRVHFSGFPNIDTYIYRRAIRVPSLRIRDGHNMGPLLSLIIAFNLGLAQHLRAMECRDRKLLEKALHIYEVAYKCLKQQVVGGMENQSGIQFKIILCNNIYHVQRCLDDITSTNDKIPSFDHYLECANNEYIQELLSAVMCVLDRKAVPTSSENDSNNIGHIRTSTITRFIDLEGFWKNLAHLVLKSQCAGVA